jgi:hypothetical protein
MLKIIFVVVTNTEPPIEYVSGALSPGIKQPEREADNSSPPSDEVKNGRTIPPTPKVSVI